MKNTPPNIVVFSVLKEAGHKTGMVGKWHLGLGNGDVDWNGEIAPGPLDPGFDTSFIMAATNDRVPSIINGVGRIGRMAGGASALWDDEEMSEVFLNENYDHDYEKRHLLNPFEKNLIHPL